MDSFREMESELKVNLKKVCDVTGKEINPQESAPIFNEMGLLYQRQSPNKIRLIQSAALLNAALVRQKNNQKFLNDLDQLCRHVLICANAELKDASLREIADTVKTQVETMRKYARSHLQVIKRLLRGKDKLSQARYTKHVKCLQRNVSESYKNLMAFVSRQCISIMGQPQCNYALVGMGSLARKEITPYSDFEHILVLENGLGSLEDLKEYFRWYSTIFHIIIITLGETDLYSMCIPCLNDHSLPQGEWFYDKFTPQGISFDGMMQKACHFPLGKTQKSDEFPWTTELIKPTNEMVKYLEVKENLEVQNNLNDILTRTCFIEGDDTVYKQFSYGVKSFLKRNSVVQRALMIRQLNKDFENCGLNDIDTFPLYGSADVKRLLYRSITLFVPALARLNGIDVNSCFDIIPELLRRNVINENAAFRVSHAVAMACHARLFLYMCGDKQDNNVQNGVWGNEKLNVFLGIVTKNTLVQCVATSMMFKVCLENSISHPISFNVLWEIMEQGQCELLVLVSFGLYQEAIQIGKVYLQKYSSKPVDNYADVIFTALGIAYMRTQQPQKCIDLYDKFQVQRKFKIFPNYDYTALVSLYFVGRFQDVIDRTDEMLKSCIQTYQPTLQNSLTASIIEKTIVAMLPTENINYIIKDLAMCLAHNGFGKLIMKNFCEALNVYRILRKVYAPKKNFSNRDIRTLYPFIQLGLCGCLKHFGYRKSALHLAREILNFLDMFGFNDQSHDCFSKIVSGIECERADCFEENTVNQFFSPLRPINPFSTRDDSILGALPLLKSWPLPCNEAGCSSHADYAETALSSDIFENMEPTVKKTKNGF